MTDRNKDIYNMRMQGKTFDEIGNKYNITRERVRQIYLSEKRRAPKVEGWIAQYDDNIQIKLRRNNIYSEADLHAAYEKDKKIKGISKNALKEISKTLDEPLRFPKVGKEIDDLTGRRFGRLTVIKREVNASNGATRWLCKCDCGGEKIVERSNLTSGATRSCGCMREEYYLLLSGRKKKFIGGWTACKDKMPQKEASYLVQGQSGTMYIAQYHNYGGISVWKSSGRYNPHPIAWMPLPKPYEVEDEKTD